jgi:serine/threonine protein kinase
MRKTGGARGEGKEVQEQTYSLDAFSNFSITYFKKTGGMKEFNHLPIVRTFTCVKTIQRRELTFTINSEKGYKHGSYGVVCFYDSKEQYDGKSLTLCIKHTRGKDEIDIIKRFEEGKVRCGQVEAKPIPYKGQDHYVEHTFNRPTRTGAKKSVRALFYAYVMPAFPNILKDYRGKCSKQTIVRIIKSLNNQLKCFRKNNLCYMDIKPENILARERIQGDSNSIEVFFCDIGSNNKSTFHCPMAAKPRHPRCDNGEIVCAAFSLTVLAAQLHLSRLDIKNRETYPWIHYAFKGEGGREMVMSQAKEFLRAVFPELFTLLFTPRFLYHQTVANLPT